MTTQTAQGETSPKTTAFDAAFNAFCDIQRAQAVLSLVMDYCQESITDENVINALHSVQNEINSGFRTLERFIWPKDDRTTDKPQEFTEVERWADNHLQAAGNLYRLFDSNTKAMLVEFEAESLADAKVKAGLFL
ncbi:hypothetical protein CWO84_14825, partial [Methylomonas sp. Kb3]|uniref:hypothetical protein n=1 Tax=Methylomonas sp. Kb3 TaxID=1611544 RepID=UPI000CAF19B8